MGQQALGRNEGARPGPLKVVATEMPRDIDGLANEGQVGPTPNRHGSTLKGMGVDPTEHHLGLLPSQGASRARHPMLQGLPHAKPVGLAELSPTTPRE